MTDKEHNRMLSAQIDAAFEDLCQLEKQLIEQSRVLADTMAERDRLRDELARVSGVPFRVLDGGKQ